MQKSKMDKKKYSDSLSETNNLERPFTDLFEIEGGTQPPKSQFLYEPKEGYIRLLQIRDFGENPVPTYIPITRNLKRCKKDEILIGRYGASVGRICTGMEGAYNVALTKVVPKQQIHNRYVFHLLNSPYFQEQLRKIERSAQNGFNKDDLADIYLPIIDDFGLQEDIAKRLDLMTSGVTDVRKRIIKAKTLVKNFRRAILSAAVSGKLTENWRIKIGVKNIEEQIKADDFKFELPESWTLKSIDEIANYIGGYAYKSITFLKNGENQVLRIGNVKPLKLYLNYSPVFIPESIASETERFSVQKNDVLISMTGTKYKRDYGFACIVPDITNTRLFLNQRVACLRSKQCNPRFLLYYLQSNYFRNYLFEGETGNVNQGNVGSTTLRAIPIAIPSLEEQDQIVEKVDSYFGVADEMERQIERAEIKVSKLTQAILAKTFKQE